MSFWRRLRLIVTLFVVAIAISALAITLLKQLRNSDPDSTTVTSPRSSSSTTGL